MRDQIEPKRKRARNQYYLFDYNDRGTVVAIAYICFIFFLLLWFLSSNTNTFKVFSDFLLGKQKPHLLDEYYSNGAHTFLTEHPIITMIIFGGITMAIYLSVYCIFKWKESKFGGKIRIKNRKSGRESVRLKLLKNSLNFVEKISIEEFEDQKKNYTHE
jgi:hypothetical protein